MSLNPRRKGRLLVRVLRWVGGLALILIGLVLSIPGIPGPGLLIALFGVLVLLPESRWLQRKYVAMKRRYPRVFGVVEKRFRRRRPRTSIGRRA